MRRGRSFRGNQCTPESKSVLKLQLEAFKALQRLTRRDGETLCASLVSAEQLGVQKFLDPKALEPLVAKIMRQLGVDLSQIDLRQLKQQCRASQGQLERFATSELDRVESELSRCDDRV